MDVIMCVARRTEERRNHQTKHIKGRETRCDDANEPENLAVVRAVPCGVENHVLAEETRQSRYTGNRERPDKKGRESPRHLASESSHFADVLNASSSMNHASCPKKKQRFEKSMGHQMKNCRGVRANSASQEHVSELAHCGISEHLLDVGLNQSD